MSDLSIILLNISLLLFILGGTIQVITMARYYKIVDKEEKNEKNIDE